MPPSKRPLAEADPNALNASNKSRKSAKASETPSGRPELRSQKEPITAPQQQRGTHNGSNDDAPSPETAGGEVIEYKTKDNSKLRRLLSERGLSTLGSREELISRLENSSIDYESLFASEIFEMLKGRQVKMASQAKKTMIERLRINDKLDRDTGDSGVNVLHGQLSAFEWILEEAIATHEQALDDSKYSVLTPAQLSALLKKRKLPLSGSKTALVTRLQKDDLKTSAKKLKEIRTKHDSTKLELESAIGHPVNASEVLEQDKKLALADASILQQTRVKSPEPICDYNWHDSHWADRTERQLREICSRREMPGCGPKATMIKWLETGEVQYEDMYAYGLEQMCWKRGIRYKSGEKKVDLVRRLREADEEEEKK